MGQAVTRAATEAGIRLGFAIDAGDPMPAASRLASDRGFQHAGRHAGLLQLAVKNRKPIVIGRRPCSGRERRLLEVAGEVPCVWAGNFSVA